MKIKTTILTAAVAAALGLQAGLPGHVLAEGSGSSTSGSAAAGSKPAASANSHAEAVYKAALPLLSSSARLPEAIKYLNSNIYALTPYQATVLTLKLENLHKAALKAWESKFMNSIVQRKLTSVYKAGISMAKLAESTDDTSLRSLLKSAGESGYKLETAEGSFFPVIDYAAYRKYRVYVTADIRYYISIMGTETDLPSSKDNGLVISWGDVAARALSQEEFIQSYPKSNRISAVKALYSTYVINTFYGQNNTPLFHYDNLEMDLEAQKAYSGLLTKNNGSSPFLQKLDGLMKLLKDNGYKLDDGVTEYLKSEVPQS
ncbi:hypothetical protein [Paenibacillus jilunlii]|uniref:Uncharacterized protein n=1 Tax=Paenibacillus jilunlii TaxID=682956 RepID=A0A1G9WE37_9BACL|nr:hypothetical protein [Paenibacillus jilunlii]SDM82533.1 hypothetical protein SAMN05216191_11928 [Paenibacillus jilunlii]